MATPVEFSLKDEMIKSPLQMVGPEGQTAGQSQTNAGATWIVGANSNKDEQTQCVISGV